MSYGDAQIAALSRSRVREHARASAAMRGLRRAGTRTFLRSPVASTAAIVVGGLATMSLARSSGRVTKAIRGLTVSALSLLKLEGVLAAARALTSGPSSLVAPRTTDDAGPTDRTRIRR